MAAAAAADHHHLTTASSADAHVSEYLQRHRHRAGGVHEGGLPHLFVCLDDGEVHADDLAVHEELDHVGLVRKPHVRADLVLDVAHERPIEAAGGVRVLGHGPTDVLLLAARLAENQQALLLLRLHHVAHLVEDEDRRALVEVLLRQRARVRLHDGAHVVLLRLGREDLLRGLEEARGALVGELASLYDQAADLEEGVENGLREMELSELAANRRGLEEFHQHLRQPPERRHIVLLCDEGVLHGDNSINLPGHLLDEDGQDATHHEIGPS
mmetsp:Transcript_35153/g.59564  ORF Transcript_35153/g.59564 Transcript_35153/m.59564 type:complete len:270 (-) Transcript_35153:2075-2884(-)